MPEVQEADVEVQVLEAHIRASGRDYAVSIIDVDEGMKPERCGYSDHMKNKIAVLRDQSPCERDETLLHEMVHIASRMAHLELEEHVVAALSHQFYGMFVDSGFWTPPAWWVEMNV